MQGSSGKHCFRVMFTAPKAVNALFWGHFERPSLNVTALYASTGFADPELYSD